MANETTAKDAAANVDNGLALNRAKQWQIALFPFNNAATNLYFAFMQFFSFFAVMYLTGSVVAATGALIVGVLGVQAFASIFGPLMRALGGIIDPVAGGIMDRTRSRFGKFRPFMVIGNVILACSLLTMMVFFMKLPDSVSWLRWVIYIVAYLIFDIGYTLQCAVTRAGQSCLTNDPKQRSQFGMWNTIGMLGSIVLVNVVAMGLMPAILPPELKGSITYKTGAETMIGQLTGLEVSGAIKLFGAAYGQTFYYIMVPLVVVLSAVYTIMAVIAISGKDKPEFWGASKDPVKLKEYVGILKGNKELRWLVLSAGLNKLALTVATSAAVAYLLFGGLMGSYNGLFIPFYVLCFIFMGLFLMWGAKTGGRKGQKRAVSQFTLLAILFYVGVTILLAVYQNGNAWTTLALYPFEPKGLLYTGLFIVFYGCGYGAFNVSDQMTIPMVADVTDYETYRSGKFIPGVMGTLFSLIDKLISSLQQVFLFLLIVMIVPGLEALPLEDTAYMPGMEISAIVCFCLLPMAAWVVTLFCMSRYRLSGKKLVEIQAVNAVRKVAMAGGMSMEEAMKTWITIDQVPAEFIPAHKRPFAGQMAQLQQDIEQMKGELAGGNVPDEARGAKEKTLAETENQLAQLIGKVEKIEEKLKKENWFDKFYQKMFTKREAVAAEPSINAIPIPAEFLQKKTEAASETK